MPTKGCYSRQLSRVGCQLGIHLVVKRSIKNAPVEIGEVLAGKYRVERVLGVGGMGVVVAATHLQLDKLVALKFMLEEASEDAQVVARFAREAKAAARLHTLHICKVLDVGALENGAPYMVMEFLEGSDLRELMKKRKVAGKGPMPVERAVGYIVQACLGMAEAHAHGFVHRDLKPPNLFVTGGADGRPLIKILDFGIAKASLDGIDTSTETVMGSPAYMPPEQWEGARYVDERGDIWALGAILQFLLSGRPPFKGDSLPALFNKIASQEPASLALPELGVPPGLQAVVLRCLAKSPGNRPRSAAELANLLAPFGPDDAEQLALRASRVASVGAEGTMMGHVVHSTAMPVINRDQFVLDDAQPTEKIAAASAADGGTIHVSHQPASSTPRAAILPPDPTPAGASRSAKSRNWLPLYAVVGLAIVAIALAVLVDDAPPATDTSELASTEAEMDASAAATAAALVAPVLAPTKQEAVMAEVTLSSDPEGAEVRIDGVPKGVSPLTLPLQVGSTVWLRLDLPGHEALEQAIEVSADDPEQKFSLVALPDDDANQRESETTEKNAREKTRVIKSRKARDQAIRDSADRRH